MGVIRQRCSLTLAFRSHQKRANHLAALVDENEGVAINAIMHHGAKDAKHSGTAVIELDIELAGLLLGVLDVSAEVSDAVVSVVLGSRHPGELDKGEEGEDLGNSSGGDREEAADTVGDVGELEAGRGGEISVELNVVVVDDGAEEGSHADTAVLTLDGAAALEGLGLGIEPSEGIVDAEGLGDTELELRDSEVGRNTAGLGGGKGGGRAGKKGGDGELHYDDDVF